MRWTRRARREHLHRELHQARHELAEERRRVARRDKTIASLREQLAHAHEANRQLHDRLVDTYGGGPR